MATKEEIAQNEQFPILSPCLQLFSNCSFILRDIFVLLPRRFQSRLLQMFCMWERVIHRIDAHAHKKVSMTVVTLLILSKVKQKMQYHSTIKAI